MRRSLFNAIAVAAGAVLVAALGVSAHMQISNGLARAGVHGQNPMRYSGGLLGGSWLTALTSDLGHGKFDGAWLVPRRRRLRRHRTLTSTTTMTRATTTTTTATRTTPKAAAATAVMAATS